MNDTAPTPSDAAREAILKACLAHAPFEGWTNLTLRKAVAETDLPAGSEGLYFPGGPKDVIRFWSEQCDQKVVAHLDALDLSAMKIRDKVTAGVLARLEATSSHEHAAKRALSRLALPDALGQASAQLWASADTIWCAIGDTSTDGNYYSKRAILSGVIGTSLLSWVGDNTPDKSEARAFLDDRIANVMSFEKAKWVFKKRTEHIPNPAEILGQLRYSTLSPRRRRRRR